MSDSIEPVPSSGTQEPLSQPQERSRANPTPSSLPSPPRWVSAALSRGAEVKEGILRSLRPFGFAAAFALPSTDPRILSEFGRTVYGPFRATLADARADLRDLVLTFQASELEFRKEVALQGAQGGTASRMPLTGREPLIKRVHEIFAPHSPVPGSGEFGEKLRIWGSRRDFVSVEILFEESPETLQGILGVLRRCVDLFADLLGACVDVGFMLQPEWTSAVVPALQEVFEGTEYDIVEKNIQKIHKIYENIKSAEIFKELEPPRTARDTAVIAGLVKQLAQRAHHADEASKKAASKAKKRLSKMRNSKNKSLIIYNVSKTADEQQLRDALGGENAGIKELVFGKSEDGKFKGYVFAVMKSAEAAEKLLSLDPPIVCGRYLKIGRHGVKAGIESKLKGWGLTDATPVGAAEAPPGGSGPAEEEGDFEAGRVVSIGYREGKLFSLSAELQERVKQVVQDKPNCNIGVIKQRIGEDLDPAKYGFKNLVSMLASVPEIEILKHYGDNPKQIAYTARFR